MKVPVYEGWIVSKLQSLTILEGDSFNWRGCFSVGGYPFHVEEGAFDGGSFNWRGQLEDMWRRVHLIWRKG